MYVNVVDPYAQPQPAPLPPRQQVSGWGAFFAGVAGGLALFGLGVVVYKAYQELTDEEYGGRNFPRHKTIEEARKKDRRCDDCGGRYPYAKLRGDHKIPYSKGGATSKHNHGILCVYCNLTKSDKMSLADEISGRYA